MCDFLSGWVSADERIKPELVCDVPYTSHNEMFELANAGPCRDYREFEWIGEEVESLDVRIFEQVFSTSANGLARTYGMQRKHEGDSWLKARIIDKYPIRQKLLESLGERRYKGPGGLEWRYWQGRLEDNGKPAISWPNGAGMSCKAGKVIAARDNDGKWHEIWSRFVSPAEIFCGGVLGPPVTFWSRDQKMRVCASLQGIVTVGEPVKQRNPMFRNVPLTWAKTAPFRVQSRQLVGKSQPINPIQFLTSSQRTATFDIDLDTTAKDGKSVEILRAVGQKVVDISGNQEWPSSQFP